MWVHLWTGGPMPPDYLELMLCRDIYHCPPSQLPPLSTIYRHLAVMRLEAKIRKVKNNGR